VAKESAPRWRAGVWPRWWRDPDRRSVSILVVVPAVVFVLPALAGHPAVAGDNVLQNYPLRVLTGQLIRSGHLPLWNPLIWSGSPLLAGMNAGSFFPGTLLFVFLPGMVAWVLNMLAVYWAAGIGIYVLCRRFGLAPLAALLASITYAYSGAMAGQMIHIEVVQAYALVPWIVLAELQLARAVLGPRAALARADVAPSQADASGAGGSEAAALGGRAAAWAWALVLAVLVAMVLLTGSTRGIAEIEIVAPLVALYAALRPYPGGPIRWPGRLRVLVLTAVAGCWAALIAAAQLITALHFIGQSQRASESLAYYGAGSLQPIWTVLLAVPDLFGGDGALGMPSFFNNYNLAEVTGYVGLLPLVAFFALVVAVVVRRRRDPQRADLIFWIGITVLGLLLAWGDNTVLGNVFYHIPFFGRTRLQSRNLGIVDLGLAVLLGYWVDRALAGRVVDASLAGMRRFVALVPVVIAVALCVTAIAVPARVEQAFEVASGQVGLGRAMTPWFVAQLVVAVAVGVLVVRWGTWSTVFRRRALCTVLVVDVLLFTLTSSTGLASGHVTLEPSPGTAASVLGASGRFAMFDTTVQSLDLTSSLGQPDMNVFTGLPSVQGYGSLIGGRYGAATGSHTLDTLDACALADGVFTPLRLSSLLTIPLFLAPEVAPIQTQRSPAPLCPSAPLPGTRTSRTWYLGQDLDIAQVSLVRTGVATGTPRLAVLGAHGRLHWPAETVRATSSGWAVTLARPYRGVGVVVHGPVRQISDASTVTTPTAVTYRLDGYLQDALGQTRWHFAQLIGEGVVFMTATVLPPMWIQGRPPDSSVRQVRTTRWGEAVAAVRASAPVTVVRSESALPGWQVRAVPAGGGRAQVLPVRAVGLVQGVRVPAGHWILTYTYHPAGLRLGLVGSALGVASALVVGVMLALRRRRRRPARPAGSRTLDRVAS